MKNENCMKAAKKCLKIFLMVCLRIHQIDSVLQEIVETYSYSLKRILKILQTENSKSIQELGIKIFMVIATGNNNTTQVQ